MIPQTPRRRPPGGAHGAPRRAIIGAGCSNVSIVNLQGGVVTRGVSFDVPRLKGAPYLDPTAGRARGYSIRATD